MSNEIIKTRRNYVDFGIAFDSQWNLAVLPEEINANAFIRPDNTTKELFLSDKNINNYLHKYYFLLLRCLSEKEPNYLMYFYFL